MQRHRGSISVDPQTQYTGGSTMGANKGADKGVGKGPETGLAKTQGHEVLLPMTITAARLVDEGGSTQEVVGLPAEFKTAETLAGFPPSAKFDKPGGLYLR